MQKATIKHTKKHPKKITTKFACVKQRWGWFVKDVILISGGLMLLSLVKLLAEEAFQPTYIDQFKEVRESQKDTCKTVVRFQI